MAVNYGIGYCERVLSQLKAKEDKMIAETGYGFDYLGQDIITERKYNRLLKRFRLEKEQGLTPTYSPSIHDE